MKKRQWKIYGEPSNTHKHFICERDLNEIDLINEGIKMHSIHYVLCPQYLYIYKLMASHSFTVFVILRNIKVHSAELLSQRRFCCSLHFLLSSCIVCRPLTCAVESINNKRVRERFWLSFCLHPRDGSRWNLGQGADCWASWFCCI